jgi:hypothetical protein
MAGRSRSAVYLSGWEYNRLLSPDPTVPRNSALPGSIFWSGSHQLWMFETVYCGQDSFENEVAATERLGWTTGEILRDLVKQGILRTVDWQAQSLEVKDALNLAQRTTLSRVPPDAIRRAIAAGDAATLELAKHLLLEPVLNALGCIDSGAPNSVATWIHPGKGERRREVDFRLQHLANSAVPGLTLCRPPGTGVPQTARDRQRHIQETVEAPLIPQLLAGEQMFAGPRGFEEYLRVLEHHKGAYSEINAQLRHDWRSNRTGLYRLREAAATHLWPDLHTDWIPRLLSVDDRGAVREFNRWVRGAVAVAPIANYLTAATTEGRRTSILVGALGSSTLAALLNEAGLPLAEAIVSATAATVGTFEAKKYLDRVARLGLFYQEVRKIP